MLQKFFFPLLISLFFAITATAQEKVIISDNRIEILHPTKNTTIQLNNGLTWQRLINTFDALNEEDIADLIMAIDTPPNDTSSFSTIEVNEIESDSGDMIEIIFKGKNGVTKKIIRMNRNLIEDYNFDWKTHNLLQKRKDSPHNYAPAKRTKAVESDWFSLDIGFNGLLHKGSVSLPPSLSNLELDPLKSLHVNVGIYQQKINLYKRHVSLVWGINYDNNDYRFSNDIDFKVDSTGNAISYNKRQSVGFVRNKLTTRFLTIPLALRFDFNPEKKRSGHITIGAHAGYRLTSFFKTVREDDGKRKNKRRDDFLLNNFRYGAYVKIGYGNVTLFGNYVFTPLFRDNTGPDLQPFSFGLSIGGF